MGLSFLRRRPPAGHGGGADRLGGAVRGLLRCAVMDRLRPLLLLGLALVAAPAVVRAAPEDAFGRLAAAVAALFAERAPLAARQAELEAQSRAEAAEIERRKAEPAGPVRDLRLGQLLASSRQRADELSRMAADLRRRDQRLGDTRRALVEAGRAALGDPALPPVRREAIGRAVAEAERALAAAEGGGGQVRVAPPLAIDPLDGPTELSDRADRLRDDEDKLRREAARLAPRIDELDARKRLREHAAELQEDLFIESGVARRAIRLAPATSGNTTSFSDKAPSFVATPGQAAGVVAEGPATILRGVVDPSTIEAMRGAGAGRDPDLELRSLRKAATDLEARARDLARREAELRQRAAELRRR